MLARLLILAYFTLYQVGPGLAQVTGVPALQLIWLAPAPLYVLVRVVMAIRTGVPVPRFSAIWVIFAYAVTFSLLYFPRASSGIAVEGNISFFCANVLFWHFAYSSDMYRGHVDRFFKDLWTSLALGVLAGFFVAQQAVGFNFTPGAIHDLAESVAFIRSDLDVPIFAQSLGLVGIVYLWSRKRLRPSVPGVTWLPVMEASWGAALLSFSILILFLYERRTPLIAMCIVAGLLSLPVRWQVRSLYGVFIFPIIPFFWSTAVRILIPLTQNEFVAALLSRNDPETYLTATNRLAIWIKAIAYIADFRLQHLWGYGGAPASVLAGSQNWTQVHNTFMQMVFDAGFITLGLAIAVLIQMYRRLAVMMQIGVYRGHAVAIFAVFVGWLVMSGVEPMLRAANAGHMLIVALAVAVANLYCDTTPTPLGSKEYVLNIPARPGESLQQA